MKSKIVEEWIEQLDLVPHPEGGFYKEVIRDEANNQPRGAYSSIYFLLTDDNISHFHRIDADEIWYYHAGDTLTVHMIDPDGQYHTVRVGPNVSEGDVLQYVVPKGTIFASSIEGGAGYALVGCMCQPGFSYAHFELLNQQTLRAAYPHLTDVIARYGMRCQND